MSLRKNINYKLFLLIFLILSIAGCTGGERPTPKLESYRPTTEVYSSLPESTRELNETIVGSQPILSAANTDKKILMAKGSSLGGFYLSFRRGMIEYCQNETFQNEWTERVENYLEEKKGNCDTKDCKAKVIADGLIMGANMFKSEIDRCVEGRNVAKKDLVKTELRNYTNWFIKSVEKIKEW